MSYWQTSGGRRLRSNQFGATKGPAAALDPTLAAFAHRRQERRIVRGGRSQGVNVGYSAAADPMLRRGIASGGPPSPTQRNGRYAFSSHQPGPFQHQPTRRIRDATTRHYAITAPPRHLQQPPPLMHHPSLQQQQQQQQPLMHHPPLQQQQQQQPRHHPPLAHHHPPLQHHQAAPPMQPLLAAPTQQYASAPYPHQQYTSIPAASPHQQYSQHRPTSVSTISDRSNHHHHQQVLDGSTFYERQDDRATAAPLPSVGSYQRPHAHPGMFEESWSPVPANKRQSRSALTDRRRDGSYGNEQEQVWPDAREDVHPQQIQQQATEHHQSYFQQQQAPSHPPYAYEPNIDANPFEFQQPEPREFAARTDQFSPPPMTSQGLLDGHGFPAQHQAPTMLHGVDFTNVSRETPLPPREMSYQRQQCPQQQPQFREEPLPWALDDARDDDVTDDPFFIAEPKSHYEYSPPPPLQQQPIDEESFDLHDHQTPLGRPIENPYLTRKRNSPLQNAPPMLRQSAASTHDSEQHHDPFEEQTPLQLHERDNQLRYRVGDVKNNETPLFEKKRPRELDINEQRDEMTNQRARQQEMVNKAETPGNVIRYATFKSAPQSVKATPGRPPSAPARLQGETPSAAPQTQSRQQSAENIDPQQTALHGQAEQGGLSPPQNSSPTQRASTTPTEEDENCSSSSSPPSHPMDHNPMYEAPPWLRFWNENVEVDILGNPLDEPPPPVATITMHQPSMTSTSPESTGSSLTGLAFEGKTSLWGGSAK
ncbi:hypothetical protein MPSEU_000826600 [Mayamaea pseudoterrestris]|nr:hypothetical protein MPSEU_000826600 [Mayamaea pseudoterrestris]